MPVAAAGSSSTITSASLLPSLNAHNTSFLTLLNLIPPKYYLAANEDDDEDGEGGHINTKYMKNKKRKTAEEVKNAKLAEKDKKRAKLDPENLKTVSQVQEERAREEARKQQQGDSDEDDDDEDEDSDGEDVDDDDDDDEDMAAGDLELDDEDDGQSQRKPAARTQLPTTKTTAPPLTQQDSISTLRERLQNKIAGMQNRRRTSGGPSGANMVGLGGGIAAASEADGDDDASVASTRDELLEERRRRRGEVRDNRRRARKEARRQEEAASSSDQKKGPKAKKPSTSAGTGTSLPPSLLVRDSDSTSKQAKPSSSFPVSSDINFSSLQFPEDPTSSKKRRDKQALPSNPKQALEMLQARKEKKQNAAADGEASKDDDPERWAKVQAAARGVKIRDDEKILKKAIKRREKEKSKSSLEWNKRDQDIKDAEAAKQKKRTENLANRKANSKKGGKAGAAAKKKTGGAIGGGKKTKDRKFGGSGSSSKAGGGASRAGFEGRKLGGGSGRGGAKSGGKGKGRGGK